MNQVLFILLGLLSMHRMAFCQPGGNAEDKKDFILASARHTPVIYVSDEEEPVVRIAANALAGDIEKITGKRPEVTSDTGQCKASVVVIGTVSHNDWIKHLFENHHLPAIRHQWEHFLIRVLDGRGQSSGKRILLVAGSDARGTAYGIFTLSRLIGVSPWQWWADVVPRKRNELKIRGNIDMEEGPSVKYRGIFLNDEDWGLRPWASKTFEPKLGNIGPKTYSRIFELLLRLRANTIWPAMHPGTTPFFKVAGNEQMARRYDIVVGTSHAEPMMRNNVGEWDQKRMGAFNYVTNKDSVFHYWESRVKQVAHDNDIYTIGMRGVHDSKMEGAETVAQEAGVLEEVFHDQRSLLKKYVNPDINKIPQAFIPYKEVLPVYDYGLKVPDDVTLVWPDDNYGYIRRLSDPREQKRSGSSGVYYHLSYWGRPHDYLWLSSTQPGLIWEEMTKAWDYGARRIWIANVGDIKPAAYDIEFFLNLAWNIHRIKPDSITQYMQDWAARQFGDNHAAAIAEVMNEYYRLAFIRRPEFMGWSQTEPTTATRNSAFSPFFNGDELAHRIAAYQGLVEKVRRLGGAIPSDRSDAFFELVAYPVLGAAYMNEKFLYAQKSRLFANYALPIANDYARLSRNAYDSIKAITEVYNQVIAGGKWKHIISMSPRDLPVYQMPELPKPVSSRQQGVMVWLEGQPAPLGDTSKATLPRFNPYAASCHFIRLFNQGVKPETWRVVNKSAWIHLSKSRGMLDKADKLEVTINWAEVPVGCETGTIAIEAADTVYSLTVPLAPAITSGEIPTARSLVEQDGHVFMQAGDFFHKVDQAVHNRWRPIQGLGFSNDAYAILPTPAGSDGATDSSYLEYRFYTYSKGPAEVKIFTLPTHPVNQHVDVRVAVAIDDGPLQVMSFKTTGRSNQWKQNVLRNQAINVCKHDFLKSGWHTMKLYALDPGVVLDQAAVDFKPDQHFYVIPLKK